ncbi:alpha/beta-Hydrolases superfamily protein [Tasmannia lanceolata]|uniref:alpha/beta-Hydrolases superfamily protein n=1 Tax=Tasmannia lanceolata TaxID=3420 RepID=UPI0040641E9C
MTSIHIFFPSSPPSRIAFPVIAMEASVRLLNSVNPNRHLSLSILNTRHFVKTPSKLSPLTLANSSLNPTNPFSAIPFSSLISVFESPQSNLDDLVLRNRLRSIQFSSLPVAISRYSIPSPNSNPLGFHLPFSASNFSSSPFHEDQFNFFVSDSIERFPAQNQTFRGGNGGDLGFGGDKGPVLTVVLLGWLGAEQKHLKRYAALYNSRGIRSVSFVVPVKDALARRVEKRIEDLSLDLISWLSEKEKDGRERGLIFHTFSNTGWLSYGAVLGNLQQRGYFFENIKGCVIDSGGDPEINPQVWAAGFAAALLKKRSSLTYEGDAFDEEKNKLQVQDDKLPLLETVFLSILEKFFSILLKLPDVNRTLSKVISTLSDNQPPCPQLYLYSTADNVIPVSSVEFFIQEQKKSGRNVWTYNFGSSPHVDHLRTFPVIYSAEIHKFLEECTHMAVENQSP